MEIAEFDSPGSPLVREAISRPFFAITVPPREIAVTTYRPTDRNSTLITPVSTITRPRFSSTLTACSGAAALPGPSVYDWAVPAPWEMAWALHFRVPSGQ